MIDHQKHRIQEVLHYLDNTDVILGYRKMLDCAMDTQNMDVYREALSITEWKEQCPDNLPELAEKCRQFLLQIMEMPVKATSSDQVVLTATDIAKSYGSNKFSLGPVSVTIKKGQVYGLVGENGNGKTTLLRILAKEIDHDRGNLTFSFSHQPQDEYDLKTKLVYIPQRTERWYGSLKDNLKFVLSNYGVSPEENETRTLMMIARLGLWNYKHLKWDELSSGYKMRFELARTLLRQPEILLLDEPLANLDVLAQQTIIEDLKAICNSISTPIALILSSQQLYEVEKISDKVIFLKNGQYKDNTELDTEHHDAQLIVEIDVQASREQLLRIFEKLSLEGLTFNGGIYVSYFAKGTTTNEVLAALGNSNVHVTYIRDISTSTRRFFVN